MASRIDEYKSGQQRHHLQLERFYQRVYSKGKSRLLIQRIIHHDKMKWLVGALAITAHAVATTETSSPRQQKHTFRLPFYYHYELTWMHWLLVDLMLWSAGFSLAWYTWLSHKYTSRVKAEAKQMADEMDHVSLEPKSKVWMIRPDDHTNNVIGVAMIRPCPQSPTNSEQREGLIQVTALTSQTRLILVQTAIQFARQQGIKVIYTQNNIRKNTGEWFVLK